MGLIRLIDYARQSNRDHDAPHSTEAPVSIIYTITKMSYDDCTTNIAKTLEKVEDVISTSTSFEQGKATIICKSTTDEAKVLTTLEELNFIAIQKSP